MDSNFIPIRQFSKKHNIPARNLYVNKFHDIKAGRLDRFKKINNKWCIIDTYPYTQEQLQKYETIQDLYYELSPEFNYTFNSMAKEMYKFSSKISITTIAQRLQFLRFYRDQDEMIIILTKLKQKIKETKLDFITAEEYAEKKGCLIKSIRNRIGAGINKNLNNQFRRIGPNLYIHKDLV